MSIKNHYDLYWKYKIKSADNIKISGDGEYTLVSSLNEYLHVFDGIGNLIWKKQIDGLTAISISENSKYIAVSSKSDLFLFTIDGKVKWKKNINKISTIAISIIADLIVVGTELGILLVFNLNGDEIWKKKVKGFIESGVFFTDKFDRIVVGSWNKVSCFSLDGEVLWQHKTKKRIDNGAVSNDLITMATRGEIEIINDKGKLISTLQMNYDNIEIGNNEHIHVLNDSGISVIDHNGTIVDNIILKDTILNFDISRNTGNIAAVSEKYIYIYSTALKPVANLVTKSLLFGEMQPLEFNIENTCGKQIDCDFKIDSNAFDFENCILPVKLDPYETKIKSYMVTPVKPGDHEIIICIDNECVILSSNVHVDIGKIKLGAILYPKYKFNVEDDDATIIIEIENNSQVVIKKISIEENEGLSIEELLPGSKEQFEFKVDLDEGIHNISKTIKFHDEFGNVQNVVCQNSIKIEKAPFVWDFFNVENLMNGVESSIIISFKNIVDKAYNLKVEMNSDFIQFHPNNFNINLGSLDEEKMELQIVPNKSGNVPINISIEDDSHTKDYTTSLDVGKSSSAINVKTSIDKTEYVIYDEVAQNIELTNVGEMPALNVIINDLQKIPSIQPNETVMKQYTHTFDEIAHVKLPPIMVKYENSDGKIFEIESDEKLHLDVVEKKLDIQIPDIELIENISKIYEMFIENTSNSVLENIECNIIINNLNIDTNDEKQVFERIEPKSKCMLKYPFLSSVEGISKFEISVQFDDEEIISSGSIITRAKLPQFELSVDDSELLVDSYSLLKVNLRNTSEVDANRVSVKLNIPFESIEDSEINYEQNSNLVEIKSEQSVPLVFNFKPNNAGKIKFDVVVSFESAQGKRNDLKLIDFITIHHEDIPHENGQPIVNVDIGDIFSGPKIDNKGGVMQRSNIGSGVDEGNGINVNNESGVMQRTNIGMNGDNKIKRDMGESERAKIFRNMCVRAFDDKVISDDERGMLDDAAKNLALTKEEKREIENETFGDLLDKENNYVIYQKFYNKALSNDGIVSQDERQLLDGFRENLNLTYEEQKSIEDKINIKYGK